MRLEEEEIQRRLAERPGWQLAQGKIQRKYRFKDFRQSMHFVNQIAELAEQIQHHPDILIHYNQVIIQWWTWKHRGVTEQDLDMAARCDAIYQSVPHYEY